VENPAAVAARDTTNDLALLVSDLHAEASEPAAFRSGIPVRAGESIAVYGFPLPGALSANGNVVSGDVSALTGLGDDVRYFQISAPVQPGDSGGPLLDDAGLVVGMVNAELNSIAVAKITGDLPQNVNFAIKGNVTRVFSRRIRSATGLRPPRPSLISPPWPTGRSSSRSWWSASPNRFSPPLHRRTAARERRALRPCRSRPRTGPGR
jgi:S1-C subfamily serine protease